MIHLHSDIRLTDELERKLMQEAIEEQARFRPGRAIKNLFVKLANTSKKSAAPEAGSHAKSAA